VPFGEPFKARVGATVSRAGVGALSHVSTARAQRYVVAEELYRPFEGLPNWLSSRTDDRGFLADIATLEADVHEHKVFDIREPALLEHRHGYAFLKSGLVQESLTYWQLDTGPTPKGFRDYLAWLINEESITFVPQAVSMRARWEGNFWHLHDNVLSKLIAVDELALPDDVPLLVGPALWESRYFAELRTLSAFRDRNWVLHDRPIRADRLVVILEGSFRRANMVFVHQSVADAPVAASPTTPDRFFLSREAGIERHLDNEPELAQRLAPSGFSVLRAERLSLPERLQTFRAARCVVLPLGAGLANVVHRIGQPTGIVEVFPADKQFAQPYGPWLSREFGFAYRAVVGSPLSSRGSFTVDPTLVRRAVEEVLDQLPHDIPPAHASVREFLHLPRIGRSRHRRPAALPHG
jgi:Glycosyltransferase 61